MLSIGVTAALLQIKGCGAGCSVATTVGCALVEALYAWHSCGRAMSRGCRTGWTSKHSMLLQQLCTTHQSDNPYQGCFTFQKPCLV